jgi:hypothetical protein
LDDRRAAEHFERALELSGTAAEKAVIGEKMGLLKNKNMC